MGRTFWIVTLNMTIIHSGDSDDGSENILEKSCGEDASDMSDEDFPVTRMKRFAGKKGVDLRKKTVKGESGRKREKKYRKYISSEIEGQPQRL